MKRFLLVLAIVTVSLACTAEDRPVIYDQLPAAAKTFIETNYPGETVSYAIVDDDLVRPDYTVRLSNGVEIHFTHAGALEKISSNAGVPDVLVPVQIRDYVGTNFSNEVIVEYEVGRRQYEVKLSNGLELKFNNSFRVVEVDD